LRTVMPFLREAFDLAVNESPKAGNGEEL